MGGKFGIRFKAFQIGNSGLDDDGRREVHSLETARDFVFLSLSYCNPALCMCVTGMNPVVVLNWMLHIDIIVLVYSETTLKS